MAEDGHLQLSQLRWVTSSRAGATGLAENYAGLDIGFGGVTTSPV